MPSEEAIQNARDEIEKGLRANELAKQEISILRKAGMTKEADERETERRRIETELMRLRAIFGA